VSSFSYRVCTVLLPLNTRHLHGYAPVKHHPEPRDERPLNAFVDQVAKLQRLVWTVFIHIEGRSGSRVGSCKGVPDRLWPCSLGAQQPLFPTSGLSKGAEACTPFVWKLPSENASYRVSTTRTTVARWLSNIALMEPSPPSGPGAIT
jgi:hypothetical protein